MRRRFPGATPIRFHWIVRARSSRVPDGDSIHNQKIVLTPFVGPLLSVTTGTNWKRCAGASIGAVRMGRPIGNSASQHALAWNRPTTRSAVQESAGIASPRQNSNANNDLPILPISDLSRFPRSRASQATTARPTTFVTTRAIADMKPHPRRWQMGGSWAMPASQGMSWGQRWAAVVAAFPSSRTCCRRPPLLHHEEPIGRQRRFVNVVAP
jgi:hypothetical protein